MTFALEHFCEPLMDDSSYATKKMFGGLAIYFNDMMVLVLSESPGDREWKGQTFDFDIWNGVLVCTSREHHDDLIRDFPSLTNHPVLGKWLFLPTARKNFENTYEEIVNRIASKDSRIGIVPGSRRKKRKTKKGKKKRAKKASQKSKAKKRSL